MESDRKVFSDEEAKAIYDSAGGIGIILVFPILRKVMSAAGLPENLELLDKVQSYILGLYPFMEMQQDCRTGSFLTVQTKVINLWEKYREQQDRKSIEGTSEDKDSLYRATKEAWKAPYIGNGLKTLPKAVLQAHGNKRGKYSNFFAIIQSSRMGKSRTVDELAKIMLTLPFNLRQTDPDNAYPPPDAAVRDHFSEFHTQTHRQIANQFLAFFATVFQVMGDKLEGLQNTDNLVKDWYDLLNKDKDDINGNETIRLREEFYREAIVLAKDIEGRIQVAADKAVAENPKLDMTEEYRRHATLFVVDAVHMIVKASSHTDSKKPAILMYFDESHTLLDKKCLCPRGSRDEDDTYFDALCSALNALEHLSVFWLFMSTNSFLHRYAPTGYRHPSHCDSDRDSNPQPPFTELGFDCHPSFPIKSNAQLTIDDISSVEFMCRFRRPLFWSLYEEVPPKLTPAGSHRPHEMQVDWKGGIFWPFTKIHKLVGY